jgi:signal transduction histidine kinase
MKVTPLMDEEVGQFEDVVFARLDNYTIFAALKKHEKLKTEKLYLLRLFVLNAAKAIHNAELREKLLQKEKLSAVGNAVSMMMHDLRSPIKNIKSLTDILRTDLPDNEWLNMIDECSEQASEIFEDFLDFIKETPVKKMPVNIDQVIEEGIKLAEARNNNGKVTIYREGETGLVIAGDISKLKRSVMNLVNNAIDALLDHKINNPCIHISVSTDKAAGNVMIAIRDNGPGIPKEILKTLFDPFVTKQKTGGTGLGLAIVKQYIIGHGGEIKVDNKDGAIFTITLPLQS